MVKPCFIWKHDGVFHVADVHGNVYSHGSSVENAVASAVRNGVDESEIEVSL